MKIPRVVRTLLFASIGLVCGSAWAQVVTEFGTGITAGAAVVAIAQGPDGNLWFTEAGLAKIGRITLAGVVTEFGGLTAGANPRGIARGPDGNLWFTEAGLDKIGRITLAGVVTEFSAGITAGAKPGSITAGPDGNMWFTENGIDRIGRINPTTGVVTEYSAGITAGASPFGITAGPDGNLWFTENVGNRIGKIDPTTGVVTEYSAGITLPPPGGSGPLFITVGSDGNLWFTEVSANQIARITPAGVVTEFGGLTAGAAPNGITAGSDGNLWFTENIGNAIGRITPAGVVTEFTAGITANAQPRRLTSGLDGNLWFPEFGIDRIGRITTGGNTRVASNVNVDLSGGTSGPGGVSISFAQVTAAGDTTGTTAGACPAAPSGFSLGTPAWCYDLTTNAVFTPPARVCINYSGVSFASGAIALLNDEAGTWVDVTTSVDTTNHIVCGNVNSLSPFVVAEKVKPASPTSFVGTDTGLFGTMDLATGVFTQLGGVQAGGYRGLGTLTDGTIVAVDGTDHFVRIDRTTGAVTTIGATGVSFSVAAGLFGVDFSNRLFRIDPLTGAATLIGATGIAAVSGSSGSVLAQDATSLYYIFERTGPSPIASTLYAIDPATGAASVVGPTGVHNLVAGGFVNGTLYAFSGDFPVGGPHKIHTINVATGAATVGASYSSAFNVFAATTAAEPHAVSVVSRRVHGAAGTFDLPLNAAANNPTTEPRQGPVFTIVFIFDAAVTAGTVAVTEGTATPGVPVFSGNEMRVPLTGVANQQYVTVAVSNVDSVDGGAGGSASIRIGFLLGDVTQNRVVTLSDLGLVNAQIAQFVNATNYLKDVNASGTLSLADKGITNTQITKALPAP